MDITEPRPRKRITRTFRPERPHCRQIDRSHLIGTMFPATEPATNRDDRNQSTVSSTQLRVSS